MTTFHVNGKVVDTVDLLRKRPLHWRFDSYPFALLYASWMIFILPNSLDLHDTFITLAALLTIHILVFIFTFCSVDFRCLVCYSKVKDIRLANACKITPAKFCGSKQLVPLHFRKTGPLTEEIYFGFRNQCFIYSNEKKTFCKLPYPSKESFDYYLKSTGLCAKDNIQLAAEKWGRNVFDYPQVTFQKLMKEHCLGPFFVFQVLCAGVWCLDGYVYFSLFILFLMLIVESIMVTIRLKMSEIFRLRPDSQMLMVYRTGKWGQIAITDLLPGDVVSIGQGKSVPSDLLILTGTAIVNEAFLTGESTPQWKVSIMGRGPEEHLSCKRDKKHVLFGGTMILQHTPDMSFHMQAPDGGCLAIVLRTGFRTTQGKLMRTILFSTERVTGNSWEGGLFFSFIVVITIIAAGYAFKKGLEDPNRSKHKLLLLCSKIITSAIPPELPMELLMAVYGSLMRLTRPHIFCTEPLRITFAGKVDICCFDKTGTLTSDDMEFSGVGGLSGDIDLETNTINVPTRTLEILASCHSLVFVDNKLVGDPLEKAAIKGIDWSYKSDDKAMPNTREDANAVQIVHRYHFASHLKRMSVVVCTKNQFYAFVKGAPETIQERLNDIPPFYVSAYKRYTLQGARVLALAYKHLPDMTVNEARNLDRQVVESGLKFAGFAVFNCPIREDSATILSELKRSSHDLVMITGDEPLTACHVATEVKIISQPVLILVPSKSKKQYQWVSPDETETVSYSEEMVEALAEGHGLCIGGDCFEMLLQTCAFVKVVPYVKVFARVSPEQKELIITTFKSSGRITLMCGDGPNDVGALKQAHVGVALLNQRLPLTLEEVKRKKLKGVDGLALIGNTSPFTAKYASVSPTIDIVREGRITLVTTLLMLKILVLNCLATAVLSVMYLDGVKLGDIQATVSGLITTIFFLSISQARTLQTLSVQRPPPSVFCFYVMLSILGQFALHALFMTSSIKEAETYIMRPESQLESNLMTTVSYMVSMLIRVTTFAVNYMGHPYKHSISEDKPFKFALLGSVVFFFVITSDVFRGLNDSLMLVPLPSGLRHKILISSAFMFFGCYTWERFLKWVLPAKMATINKSKKSQ